MKFTAYRVTEYWQRAAVYYIRMDEFVLIQHPAVKDAGI